MEYMKLLKYHVRFAVLLLFSMSGLKKWETCLWFSAINFIFWTKIFLIVFEFHQIIYPSSLNRQIFRPLQIFFDCLLGEEPFKKVSTNLHGIQIRLLECASGKNLSCASKFHLMKVETMIYFVHCHANSWISWLCFLQFQLDF